MYSRYSGLHRRPKGKVWRSNQQLKDSGKGVISKSASIGGLDANPILEFESQTAGPHP